MYGLDPQVMVDCFKAFASHINVPKGNGDVYHEPFKDTCIESDIVTTQDFIKFWGKFFAFALLEMIEISQGFKTFEPT
jgi:hypothetical protein